MARGICVGVEEWVFFLGLGAGFVWGWYVIMYSESSEAAHQFSCCTQHSLKSGLLCETIGVRILSQCLSYFS